MPSFIRLRNWIASGLLFTSLACAIDLPVSENFDDGSLENWTIVGGGTWEIEDQQLKGRAVGAEALILLNTDASDFTFTADMNVTKGIANGLTGFVFRSSAIDESGSGDHYVFRLWAAGEELKIKTEGAEEVLLSMRGSYGGMWKYAVRITTLGDDLQVFIDDMDFPALKWTDARLQSGSVGFAVSDGGEAFFDNVVVEAQ